jgi:hypothetical protein
LAKWQLVRNFFRLGYNVEELREIFRLTDWMMPLPEDLNRKFADELVALEESLNMPYITSVERIAEARGEAKGRVNILLKVLARACGPLPVEIEQRVRQLSVERLEALAEAVFDIHSLDDARVWLESHNGSRD